MKTLRYDVCMEIVRDDRRLTKSIQKRMVSTTDMTEDNILWDLNRLSDIRVVVTPSNDPISFIYIEKLFNLITKDRFSEKKMVLYFAGSDTTVEKIAVSIGKAEQLMIEDICKANKRKQLHTFISNTSAASKKQLTIDDKRAVLTNRRKDGVVAGYFFIALMVFIISCCSYFLWVPKAVAVSEMDAILISAAEDASTMYPLIIQLSTLLMVMAYFYVRKLKKRPLHTFLSKKELAVGDYPISTRN